MPLSLADYARLEKDPLRSAVIDVFRRESFMMEYLSWENVDTLGITVIRTKSLPSVGWRKINAAFSESKGQVEPWQERVFDLGGYVDVDKLLVKAKSVTNQRALQSDMFVTSLSYAFNDYFINGDPTIEEDGFIGLWYRSLSSNYVNTATQHLNNNGLEIQAGATGLAANQDTFLDKLEELRHACDGHKADAFLGNDSMYLRLLSAIRQKGLFATVEDSYGRQVMTYGPGGPKILDLGVKADQTTRIIGNAENDAGTALTGGDTTSVYACKIGQKYLVGIQLYAVDVQDIGLLEDGRTFRTVIDWPVGIYHVNPRSFARLSGTKVA